MTLRTSATVATENGAKYAQQLCKHWGHRTQTQYEDGIGTVNFESAIVTFTATGNHLQIVIEATDGEAVERYKGVVQSHLDRFAFKEAPLTFAWTS